MSQKMKIGSLVAAVVLALGFIAYVYTAPYERFPGVRIGGELTARIIETG